MRSRIWFLVQHLREVKKVCSHCNSTRRCSGVCRDTESLHVWGTGSQCKRGFLPACSVPAELLCKTRYLWLFMTESGRGLEGFRLTDKFSQLEYSWKWIHRSRCIPGCFLCVWDIPWRADTSMGCRQFKECHQGSPQKSASGVSE